MDRQIGLERWLTDVMRRVPATKGVVGFLEHDGTTFTELADEKLLASGAKARAGPPFCSL